MKEKQKTILVTGGSGFIGSVTCKLLVDSGYNVINIDRNKRPMEGIIQYPFDLDNHQIKGILELTKPDAIIHLAAHHSVPESVEKAKEYYFNNVANTIILLRNAIDAGIQNFVFSSSSSVYGKSDMLLNSEIDELNPLTPYGKTKAIIETVLKDLSAVHDFNYTSLRYFCAAGSYEGLGYRLPEKKHVLPVLVEKAIQEETFTINGSDFDTPDGTPVRDYTHVFDIATAHLASLNYLFDGGESGIFNIGAGSPKSIRDLIAEVEKQTGKTVDVAVGPRRVGDTDRTDANTAKALALLGWEPIKTLEDIVSDEISAYK